MTDVQKKPQRPKASSSLPTNPHATPPSPPHCYAAYPALSTCACSPRRRRPCLAAYHTGCIDNEENVLTWGQGGSGRLGHDSEHDLAVPTVVDSLVGKGIQGVRCYHEHTIASTVALEGSSDGLFDANSQARLRCTSPTSPCISLHLPGRPSPLHTRPHRLSHPSRPARCAHPMHSHLCVLTSIVAAGKSPRAQPKGQGARGEACA